MASAAMSSNGSNFETFGLNIYSTVSQENREKNAFLSPASIALAMSMCAVGARERTLQQMLTTLGASTVEELSKNAENVMAIFLKASKDKQVILRLANRLYAQKAYKLRDTYLRSVRSSFKADVELADFANRGPQVVATINNWVEDQTNRLIKNLLSPDDINADTRLILVNCIYFKVKSMMIYFLRKRRSLINHF